MPPKQKRLEKFFFFSGFFLIFFLVIGTAFFLYSSPFHKTAALPHFTLTNLHPSSQSDLVLSFTGQADTVRDIRLRYEEERDIPVTSSVQYRRTSGHISLQKIFLAWKKFLVPPVSASWRGTVDDASGTLTIQRPEDFHPGNYALSVYGENGKILFSQKFPWGILAVNFDKTTYLTQDTVHLMFSILDKDGATSCGDDLEVNIVDPFGRATFLSTREGTLHLSETCGDQAVDAGPDYTASYIPLSAGTYQVTAHVPEDSSATSGASEKVMTDTFSVVDRHIFDVSREAPTRIFPKQSYPVSLLVTSAVDWAGEIRENVPSSFDIQEISDSGYQEPLSETHADIVWNVILRAGETKTLSYHFQAPPVSPEFYLLGPLAIGNDFQETREWQIASDAQTRRTCNWNGGSSSAWGTAGNWSCGFVPDNAGCVSTTDGTCYYVKINSSTNNPVLLGSTSRTISSLIITSSASFTIDSTGTLTVENQGGSQAGGFTVGQVDVSSGGSGTLNLNPSSSSTCLTSNSASIGGSGVVTSTNSNCTWSNSTASFTNSGVMSGTWSLTTQGDLTNSGAINMTGGTVKFTGSSASGVSCGATQSNSKFYSLQASKSAGAGNVVTLSGSCLFGGIVTIDTNNQLVTGTGSHAMTTTGSGLIVNNGTFTATSGNTWSFTGTGSTTIPALTYHHLAFQPASGSPTYTLASGTFTVNGNFTVGDGSNTVVVSTDTNNPTVNITGNFTTDANATLSGSGTGTITVNGNMAGVGTINLTGGTLEQRVSAAKNFGTTAGGRSWTFNNLTFSNSHATNAVTISTQSGGSAAITVGGTLRVGKSGDAATATTTLDASSRSWVFSGAVATPLTILSGPTGDFSGASSTVTYSGNNASGDVTLTSETYGTLTVNGSDETYNISGAVNGGGVTVTAGTVNINSSGSLTATGDLTVNGTLQGSGNVTVNGHVTGGGTVNMSEGTFEQRVSTAKNFGTSSGSNAWSFYHLWFSNGHGSVPMTLTTQSGGSGGITVAGTLTIGKNGDGSSATTTLDAGARTWTLSGTDTPLVRTTSPLATFTANTSTINFTSGGSVTVPALTYKNIGVGTTSDSSAGATYTLAGDTTVNGTLTIGNASSINTDSVSLGSNTLTFKISNTPLAVTNKGDITPGTSTVSFENTTSPVSVPAADYYNIQFNPASSTPTYTLGSGTFSVANAFTLSGTSATTVNAETNDPNMDIDGNFTIGSNDVFQASSTGDLSVAQNFTNNGTFTANSGTLSLDGSGTSEIRGATTFYKMNVSTAGKTIKFQSASGGSPVFTFGSTFTISGTSGSKVSLLSTTSGTQWLPMFSGGQSSITYATVQDSGCGSGTANAQIDTTSTNSGNNGSCWIFGTASSAPTSLTQQKTDTTSVSTGGWISDTSLKLSANISDPDSSDTLQLCAEALPTDTSFSNSETACGSEVSFTGSAVSANVTLTLTTGRAYHWQARVKDAFGNYSAWTSFGDNGETERDFGFDSAAPTTGSVYDGTGTGTDADFNNGSLTSLSFNWSGFSDAASGIQRYQYAIGSTSGGTDVQSWTSTATDTSVTGSNLSLRTGVTYYGQVRSVDNAGNTSAAIVSNGQRVLPLPPTAGFSPAKKAKTSSRTPTVSWSSIGDDTVFYEVCISKKNTPASNCDKKYSSSVGKAQLKITTALDDMTTYFWQVRAVDALETASSWSDVQEFVVNTRNSPTITVTKSVGVNAVLPQSKKVSLEKIFLSVLFPIFPFVSAEQFSFSNISWRDVLRQLADGYELIYIALGLVIAALLNILFTVRKPKHIPTFLFSPETKSFEKISERRKDGTWSTSYTTYYRRSRTARSAFVSAVLILAVKISAVIFLSSLLTAPHPTQALDDDKNPVVPGDILTYRLDFKNTGTGPATSFTLGDGFPSGTSYVIGSAKINGKTKTDSSDGDEVAVKGSGILFSLGSVGEKDSNSSVGYVTFQVKVINPNTQKTIQNTASINFSEMRSTDNKNTNTTENPVNTFSISGTVFNDTNTNEVLNDSEGGLSNVKISLYADDGDEAFDKQKDTFLADQVSKSNGAYSFTGIGPDDYFLVIDPDTLSSSLEAVSAADSVLVHVRGDTNIQAQDIGYATPAPPTTETNNDCALIKQASIGDTIWNDVDRDNIIDGNEAGIANVGVSLYKNTDGDAQTLTVSTDTFLSSVRTDGDGKYTFSKLSCGTYFAVVDGSSEIVTSQNFTPTSAASPKKIYLSNSGVVYSGADFGFALSLGTIGNFIYEDVNENRISDDGETGIANVRVVLYRDADGSRLLDQAHDIFVRETYTNPSGLYSFENLSKGVYFVKVDDERLNKTYTLTTSQNPFTVTLPSDAASVSDANFGFSKIKTTSSVVSPASEQKNITISYIAPEDIDSISHEEEKTITKKLITEISINEQPVFAEGILIQNQIALKASESTMVIKGKAGDCAFCEVKVYVFSDPVVYTVTTDAAGNWALEVPKEVLTEGDHTVLATIEDDAVRSSTVRIAFLNVNEPEPPQSSFSWRNILIASGSALLILITCVVLFRKRVFVFLSRIIVRKSKRNK